MKQIIGFTLLALCVSISVHAQHNAAEHNAHQHVAAPTASAMSEGEVRKIDMDARKITLRHGPIANLGMPPMTMVFQLKDPAILHTVKTGDKVKFVAEKIQGAYTVIQIEPLK